MNRPKRKCNASKTEAGPTASTSAAPHSEENHVDDVHDSEPVQKKRKYAKAPTKQSKKTDVAPEDKSALGSLCVDVLIEIFAYLNPLDLLNLSWTNKNLSRFLTSPSMAFVWKNARKKNVPKGIPKCPQGIAESQYANLMFSENCFFCLDVHGPDKLNISWIGQFKTCTDCLRNRTLFMLLDKGEPANNEWSKGYQRKVFNDCLPSFQISYGHHGKVRYYHLGTHEKWKKEYQASSDKPNWARNKISQQEIMNEHILKCEPWWGRWEQYLLREHQRMVSNRLKKLGWQSELEKLSDKAIHPLKDRGVIAAYQQRRFTETDLIKLEPHLNQVMERLRSDRQDSERRALLTKRLPILVDALTLCGKAFPPNTPLPTAGDIFKLPLVLNIVNSKPDVEEFTKEDLNPLVESYQDVVRQWRLEKEAQLLEMIRSACGESYTFNPDTVLRLATTMFSCYSCRIYETVPIWYPRVLIHEHATAHYSEPDVDSRMVYHFTRSGPWNARNIYSFLKNEREFLSNVLKEFGFDPETITAEEMDALDPIFECIPCNNLRKGRYTMKWAHLARHISECHYSKPGATCTVKPYKFEMLQGQDLECIRARFAEDNSFDRSPRSELRQSMICVHCRERNWPADIAEHVSDVHGIVNPTNADMVQNLDIVVPWQYRYSWPPRQVQPEPKEDTAG